MKWVQTQDTVYQNTQQGVKCYIKRKCSFIQSYVLPSFIQHGQVSFQCILFQTCWHNFLSTVSLFCFSRPAEFSLALLGLDYCCQTLGSDSGCLKGKVIQVPRWTSSCKHLAHLGSLITERNRESLFSNEGNEPLLKQGSEVSLSRCPYPKSNGLTTS